VTSRPRLPALSPTRLPALLLCVVALHQIWLAHDAHLSPWNGGGFGMFSSTDVFARRHLHVWLVSPEFRQELDVPSGLREEMRGALALPTDARLRNLGERLLAAYPETSSADALTLTVYAMRFDARTLVPSGVPLRSLRMDLRGESP
jgi:hypothetical protein